MIGAISSSANDLFGALLAVANPEAMGRPSAAARLQRSAAVGAVDESQATGGKSELTDEERQEVQELERRDREVRQHEQAHLSTAGQYSQGGPSFEFQSGPDGRRYAVGGEVSVDTSEVPGDPRATIEKMRIVRRAALAPANPSATDRQVAAKAARTEAQARAELAAQRADQNRNSVSGNDSSEAPAAQSATVIETPPNSEAKGNPPGTGEGQPEGQTATKPAASNEQPAGNRTAAGKAQPVASRAPGARLARSFARHTLDLPGRYIDVRT